MQNNIAVVIPCHNENLLIEKVIAGLPDWINHIITVDDCSTDNTSDIIHALIAAGHTKITHIRHETNQGVGGAIASGYKKALELGCDIAVVMAGDAQMDPADLPAILEPIIQDKADYSKGNRFFSGDAWEMIPRVRYLGNAGLSLLTKIASGYWHIADSQSGYTAINRKALQTINWDKMYKRYGQPNDLLVRLNIYNFRVCDVPIRPVYGVGEKSGIKPFRMMPKLAFLVWRLFIYRLIQKYIIRDFHPLVFFYLTAFVLMPVGVLSSLFLLYYRIFIGPVAETSALFAAFSLIMGLQFMFFGMWMDMDYNKHLK